MYSVFRGAVLRLLALPSGPPEPPPGGSVVKTFNASKRYLAYRLLAVFVGCGLLYLVAAALVVGGFFKGAMIVGIVVAFGATLILAASYIANRLEFELRYYILTDRSLRIREGVFFLRESTLTFANVQNLRIRKGPLQQLFGIADVLVDTAGGAATGKDGEGNPIMKGHRGTIQGIENPAEVRELVLGLLKKYRDAGLGDPDDSSHASDSSLSPAVLREILVEVKSIRAVLAR